MKRIMLVLSFIAIISVVGFIEPTNVLTMDDIASEVKATTIPKLYFEGDILDLKDKKTERTISVKYEGYKKSFKSYAKIKLQGTSSLWYEKKNYNITFYKDKKLEEKLKVDFGWGKQSKYCLKANWVDKTHARNIVTANIAADMQNKYGLFKNTPHNGTIDGTPVEIYLNKEFLGLYTLNIPKDDWMFNMDEDNENHIVLAGEIASGGSLFTSRPSFNDWEVEVGEANDETLAKLIRLYRFIKYSSDEDFKKDFSKYLDLDSTLNYFILMEYAELNDNISKNMLLVTYDGNVWYPSLYDLDTSWGTVWHGRGLLDPKERVLNGQSKLWERVEKAFPNELADRYFELRKDLLEPENVLTRFKNFENSIPEKSFENELKRWEFLPGYDLVQIEEFLNVRVPIMDKLFSDMYTYDKDISVTYTKNENGTITARLTGVRNDIILLNGDSYTFTEDGEHAFYYVDYLGNKSFTIAKATGIKKGFNIFKKSA